MIFIVPNDCGNEILLPRLKYNEIKRLLKELLCQWSGGPRYHIG